MRRLLFSPLAVASVALILPVAASAGTVSIPDPDAYPPLAVFNAKSGEQNRLTVESGNFMNSLFRDAGATLRAGGGCDFDGSAIACFPAAAVDAYLGDRDDTASVEGLRGHVWAGSGDDVVSGYSNSGPLEIYGQGGDDELGAGGIGGQLVDGGAGDDLLYVGGFEGTATGIGGSGNDVMVFVGSYQLSAVLDGGSGADRITLQPGVLSTVAGGSGDDTVDVAGDRPVYSTGGYTIEGGSGDDHLSGGPDADIVNGGGDDDTIDVAGGGADTVSCGRGRDVVLADASDTIASDCEITQLSAG